VIRLWPFQSRAVEIIKSTRTRALLVSSPTGSGKTVIAVTLALEALDRQCRVLALAHRRELIAQFVERLLEAGVPGDSIGIILSTTVIVRGREFGPKREAPVQVASIDSLKLSRYPVAHLVIIDEAHRAAANSYQRLARYYAASAILIGLTGTPVRLDGKPLGSTFGALLTVANYSELIAGGYLAAPRVWTAPLEHRADLTGIRLVGSDYDLVQLDRAVNQSVLVGSLVAEWLKRAENRTTVVFAVGVAHSQSIAAEFRAAGIVAEHLSGKTPYGERAAMLERLKTGETRVVVNCDVLSEGWDMPSCKCIVLARPTRSLVKYMQQAGRVMRPFGEISPILLDHAGNVLRFGLPHADRVFSLTEGDISPDKKTPRLKECPVCQSVQAPDVAECPECGTAFAVRRECLQVEGELREAVPILTDAQEQAFLARARAAAARVNAGEAWVQKVYQAWSGRGADA